MEDVRVSHYRVLEKLGEGGMGEVHVAFDEVLERKVALKTIRPARRMDAETRSRFLREARVLSQLDHPAICGIYDYIEGVDGEPDYLVLELVEGETLREAAQRGLERAEALSIALRIGEALVAAHAAGVVHRDLKPANVMIASEDQVKVLDFGLSHTGEDDPGTALEAVQSSRSALLDGGDSGADLQLTREGQIVGTLQYMSPEQARCETVTTASDMFSFGLILRELLTGAPAYPRGLAAPRLLELVKRGDAAPPSRLDEDLARLVRNLADPVPSRRPTAVGAVEELRRIVDRPRRRRRRLALAGVAAVALAGGAKYTLDLRAAGRATQEAKSKVEDEFEWVVDHLYYRLKEVGSVALLDDAVERVVSYYDALAPASLSHAEALHFAKALWLKGQVRADRGDRPEALAVFQRSLALSERVPASAEGGADALFRRGQALCSIGQVLRDQGELAGAKTSFERARDVAGELAAAGDHERALELRAGACRQMGDVLLDEMALDDAERECESALEAVRELQGGGGAPRAEWLDVLARSQFNLGMVSVHRGDLDGALAHFRAQLSTAEELVRLEPRNFSRKAQLAEAHTNTGAIHEFRSDVDAALGEFRRAVEEMRALVAHDPSNTAWRENLAGSLAWLVSSTEMHGDLPGAVALAREGLESWEYLHGRDPSNAAWANRLSVNLWQVGRLLKFTGDPEGAIEHTQRCVEISRALAEKDPSNAAFQRDLAVHLVHLGDALLRGGRAREAEVHVRAGSSLLPAVTGAEEVPDHAISLVTAKTVLAEVRLAAGDADGAKAALAEAREALRFAADLANIDLSFAVGRLELVAGRVESARGAHVAAAQAWRAALAAIGSVPPDARDCSRLALRAEILLCLRELDAAGPLVARLDDLGYKEAYFLARCREGGLLGPASPPPENGGPGH